jgi:hypothetical protein
MRPSVVHAYRGPRPSLVVGMLVALSWMGVMFALRSTLVAGPAEPPGQMGVGVGAGTRSGGLAPRP